MQAVCQGRAPFKASTETGKPAEFFAFPILNSPYRDDLGHSVSFGTNPLDVNIATGMDMFKMVYEGSGDIPWTGSAATGARGWKGLTVTNLPIKTTSSRM